MTRTKKLLFVHIPRNAGKSVAAALRRKLKGRKVEWEHARLKDANFSMRGLTKFCVVRNPYERMVSLWMFIANHKLSYETRNGKRRKAQELQKMGFEWWLLNHGKKSHNIITSDTPQVAWMTRHGKFKMDHVIRFENLVEDFCDVTGLAADVLPVTHQTQHSEYQKYYTKAAREYVAKVFKPDIKRWGYKF